jgi:hypothetical protein
VFSLAADVSSFSSSTHLEGRIGSYIHIITVKILSKIRNLHYNHLARFSGMFIVSYVAVLLSILSTNDVLHVINTATHGNFAFFHFKLPYFSVDNARVIYTKKLKFDKIRTCALYIRKRHEGSQIQ